jgi:hypothetical protein
MTDTIAITLLLISICVALPFNFYMMYRNRKVFEYRGVFLRNEYQDEQNLLSVLSTEEITGNYSNYEWQPKYRALPKYETMMYKFWVWPLTKFEK